MQKRIAVILLAGILAGMLIRLPNTTIFFGIFVPFFPLMLVGLSMGARAGAQASVFAVLTAFLAGGDQAGFSFAVFIALPTGLLLHRLLLVRRNSLGQMEWYPLLTALTQVSLLSAFLFMALSSMAGYHYKDGLQGALTQSFTMNLDTVEPETADIMRKLRTDWNFLVFALGGWFWTLTTWLMAWIANRVLLKHGHALRPHMVLTPYGIPAWFLPLVALAAALAAFGQGNDAFVGKAVLCLLMLPYFLSGMAMIHGMSLYWQPRMFWLFLIYIIIIFLFWTTIFVAAAGLYLHLSEMLDKRRKIG